MRILEKFIKNLKGFIYLFAKKRDRGCYVLGWTRLKSGASSGSPTAVAEAQVLEPSPIAFQGTLERSWIRSGGPVGYWHHHSLTYNLKTRALPHHLHGFVCVYIYSGKAISRNFLLALWEQTQERRKKEGGGKGKQDRRHTGIIWQAGEAICIVNN